MNVEDYFTPPHLRSNNSGNGREGLAREAGVSLARDIWNRRERGENIPKNYAPDPAQGIGGALSQLFHMLWLAITGNQDIGFWRDVYGLQGDSWNIFNGAAEAGRTTIRGGGTTHQAMRSALDSLTQTGAGPLLSLIRRVESTDNYNIANGMRPVNFTGMTINQVLAWQERDEVTNGDKSAAAGAYQIIRETLIGLKRDMGLTGNELFDERMQDRMAMVLLRQRGYDDFRSGRMSAEQFMRELSLEWAALPKDASGVGSHDGDGINKARASTGTVLSTLDSIRDNAPALAQAHREAVSPAPADTRTPQEQFADNANAVGGYGKPKLDIGAPESPTNSLA